MNNILKVENLSISLKSDYKKITPVQDVSFDVKPGKTLGIVGESGSGKSMCVKALMQLLPESSNIHEHSKMKYFRSDGREVDLARLSRSGKEIQKIRGGEIGMIFQEPMASFSPVYTVGNQIIEAIRLHLGYSKRLARDLAVEMLEKVGISDSSSRLNQYAYEISGGMRQRAMIALALSVNPRLLIADEPTTALDVITQAQVLDLMKSLQEQLGMAMIFISHDLGVISKIADEIAVMYLGMVVERGLVSDILKNPRHPYTKGLVNAIPSISKIRDRMCSIPGDLPNPGEQPGGCLFHTRCLRAINGLCEVKEPPEIISHENCTVRCWLHTHDAIKDCA